jgi:hypothetical protein
LRTAPPELGERRVELARAVDLEPDRMRDVLRLEHGAAPRLRAEPVQRRIRPEHRQSERYRQPHLVLGHAERQEDRQLGVSNQTADPAGAPGRVISFCASGSLRPSTSETAQNLLRASGVSSSGTSPKK